jgi:hypothetical protein
MSITVVGVFADRSGGQAGVESLVQQGVPRARVAWHRHTPTLSNTSSLQIDELATGGLVSNMVSLLDGLFDRPVAAGHGASYDALVDSEGALVSVQVDDARQAEDCLQRFTTAGALRASVLPHTDTVSFHRLYPAASD